MSTDKNIVIVGGGFAGTTLARALEKRLPRGYRIVLVSEESYTTFNPMLAEVVGASVFPEHVVAPIRQMLGAGGMCQFIMGRVTGVDAEHRRLQAGTLAGAQEIAYEHLVLAFGTRANLDLVPGLAQHALPHQARKSVEVEDLTALAMFLASDTAAPMTGTALAMDGGRTLH